MGRDILIKRPTAPRAGFPDRTKGQQTHETGYQALAQGLADTDPGAAPDVTLHQAVRNVAASALAA